MVEENMRNVKNRSPKGNPMVKIQFEGRIRKKRDAFNACLNEEKVLNFIY